MIKTVNKHRYFKGKKASKSFSRYVNYVTYREGLDKGERGRLFFNQEKDDITCGTVKRTIAVEPLKSSAIAHELVLSPGVQGVDARRYTRELMDRLGKSTGLDLNWAAVVHKGKHNHIHVLIDGRDASGKRVFLAKEEYHRLREWGDNYIERHHKLERYLEQEVDLQSPYQRDQGDKLFESLFKGAQKDLPATDNREQIALSKKQQFDSWDRTKAIAELPDEEKIYRNHSIYHQFSDLDELVTLSQDKNSYLSANEQKKLRQWIADKEEFGDDHHERLAREREAARQLTKSKQTSDDTKNASDEDSDMTSTTTSYNQAVEDEDRKRKEQIAREEKLDQEKIEEKERLEELIKEEDDRLEKLRIEEDERLAQMKQEEQEWRELEQKLEDEKREEQIRQDEERRQEYERIDAENQEEFERRLEEDREDDARREQERQIDAERRAKEYKLDQEIKARQLAKDIQAISRGRAREKANNREERSALRFERRPRAQRIQESRGRNLEWHIRYQNSQARIALHEHSLKYPHREEDMQERIEEIKRSEVEQLATEITPVDLDQLLEKFDQEAADNKRYGELDDDLGIKIDEEYDVVGKVERPIEDVVPEHPAVAAYREQVQQLWQEYVEYSQKLEHEPNLEFTDKHIERMQELSREETLLQDQPDGETEDEYLARQFKLEEIGLEQLQLVELQSKVQERDSLELEPGTVLIDALEHGLPKLELIDSETLIADELTRNPATAESSEDSDNETESSEQEILEIERAEPSLDEDDWNWLQDDSAEDDSKDRSVGRILGIEKDNEKNYDRSNDSSPEKTSSADGSERDDGSDSADDRSQSKEQSRDASDEDDDRER